MARHLTIVKLEGERKQAIETREGLRDHRAVHEEDHCIVDLPRGEFEEGPLPGVVHPTLLHDPNSLRDRIQSGHLVPALLKDKGMSAHACSDVENSSATLIQCQRLPVLKGLLPSEENRYVNLFRRSEIVSDAYGDVLSAIVERRQGRPERSPRPGQTKTGVAMSRPSPTSSRAFSRSSRPSTP